MFYPKEIRNHFQIFTDLNQLRDVEKDIADLIGIMKIFLQLVRHSVLEVFQ